MAKLLSEKEKGVFINEEEKPRYNKETEKVMKDARAGKTTSVSLEDFRDQLYS